MTRIPVAELSSVYFLNYRLLSRSIDSSNSQSCPTEFGKNAVTDTKS